MSIYTLIEGKKKGGKRRLPVLGARRLREPGTQDALRRPLTAAIERQIGLAWCIAKSRGPDVLTHMEVLQITRLEYDEAKKYFMRQSNLV